MYFEICLTKMNYFAGASLIYFPSTILKLFSAFFLFQLKAKKAQQQQYFLSIHTWQWLFLHFPIRSTFTVFPRL